MRAEPGVRAPREGQLLGPAPFGTPLVVAGEPGRGTFEETLRDKSLVCGARGG